MPIIILHLIFHPIPDVFYKIKVWRVRRLGNYNNMPAKCDGAGWGPKGGGYHMTGFT